MTITERQRRILTEIGHGLIRCTGRNGPHDWMTLRPGLRRVSEREAALLFRRGWVRLEERPDLGMSGDKPHSLVVMTDAGIAALTRPFHPDNNLPDCMIPDGAEPCGAYTALLADWRRLKAKAGEQ